MGIMNHSERKFAKRKILHVITSTGTGGAETTLLNFLAHTNREYFSHQVISLAPIGEIGEKIKTLSIPVFSAGMQTSLQSAGAFMRLLKQMRLSSTDLVHCWMYHANLAGGIGARLLGKPSLWAIHHHQPADTLLKAGTRQVARFGARLSHWMPEAIIYCAQSAQVAHENTGYDASKSVVIENGFDTEQFKPDREANRRMRASLRIDQDAVIVGHIGRFHPTKDHLTFLKAAATVDSKKRNIVFVLCGQGVDANNETLVEQVSVLGLSGRIHLLGRREDMPSVFSMLDILVSSSLSEAFPSVIGEAMSCGIPCVATDAGDSARLIADTGLVVPVREPILLAEAITQLVEQPEQRRLLGTAARRRIQEYFGVDSMLQKTEALYERMILKGEPAKEQ